MTLYTNRADLFTRPFAAAVLVVSLQAGTSLAGEATPSVKVDLVAITECDRLASDLRDKHRVAPGISDDQLDVDAAIDSCRRAVARNPENSRLHYQLGRALIISLGQDTAGFAESIAAQELRVAADRGYLAAQFLLGVSLYVTAPNKDERLGAVDWIERAGKSGHLAAQMWLGHHFEENSEISKGKDVAIAWYERARAQGSVDATVALGHLLFTDTGNHDGWRERGLHLIRSAEAMGNRVARSVLAMYSLNGSIKDFDEGAAIEILTDLASNGDFGARIALFTYHRAEGNSTQVRQLVCTAPRSQRLGLMEMLEDFNFCN